MKIRFVILLAIFLGLIFLLPPKISAQYNGVIINEIFPHPANGTENEFIELFNQSDSSVDLSGWKLDDIANDGSEPYIIPVGTIITANGYLVFYKPQTNISLNDSDDEARLLDSSGAEIAKISYKNAPKYYSYVRSNNDIWFWSNQLTPGQENPARLEYSQSVKINEILANPENGTDDEFIELYNFSNESVNLSGWQLDDIAEGGSSPYTIGEGIVIGPKSYLAFYHRQTNISLNNGGDIARLINPLGEEVSSIPYPKSEKNSSYIRDDDGVWYWTSRITPAEKNILLSPAQEKFFSNFSAFQTEKIATGEIGNYLNKRVEISGTLVDNNGQTFYVDDGSGKAKVTIQSKANFKKPKMRVGDIITVVGWVDVYRNLPRVLPEQEQDIKVSQKSNIKDQNENLKIKKDEPNIAPVNLIVSSGNTNLNNLLGDLNIINYNNETRPRSLTISLKIVIIISSILLLLLFFQYLWQKQLLPILKKKPKNLPKNLPPG